MDNTQRFLTNQGLSARAIYHDIDILLNESGSNQNCIINVRIYLSDRVRYDKMNRV